MNLKVWKCGHDIKSRENKGLDENQTFYSQGGSESMQLFCVGFNFAALTCKFEPMTNSNRAGELISLIAPFTFD